MEVVGSVVGCKALYAVVGSIVVEASQGMVVVGSPSGVGTCTVVGRMVG